MKVSKRVIYTGHVQGVGFRYTARSIAQGFAIAGFVRNAPDGSVELAAEGEAAEVTRFLDALARQMAEFIDNRQEQDQPVQGYTGFEIRG